MVSRSVDKHSSLPVHVPRILAKGENSIEKCERKSVEIEEDKEDFLLTHLHVLSKESVSSL